MRRGLDRDLRGRAVGDGVLAITAWNVAFAIATVVWAFGWAGGRVLVEQSYADAKVKVEVQKSERATKRARS